MIDFFVLSIIDEKLVGFELCCLTFILVINDHHQASMSD